MLDGATLGAETRITGNEMVASGADIPAGTNLSGSVAPPTEDPELDRILLGNDAGDPEPPTTEAKVIRGGNKRAGERETAPSAPARTRT